MLFLWFCNTIPTTYFLLFPVTVWSLLCGWNHLYDDRFGRSSNCTYEARCSLRKNLTDYASDTYRGLFHKTIWRFCHPCNCYILDIVITGQGTDCILEPGIECIGLYFIFQTTFQPPNVQKWLPSLFLLFFNLQNAGKSSRVDKGCSLVGPLPVETFISEEWVAWDYPREDLVDSWLWTTDDEPLSYSIWLTSVRHDSKMIKDWLNQDFYGVLGSMYGLTDCEFTFWQRKSLNHFSPLCQRI